MTKDDFYKAQQLLSDIGLLEERKRNLIRPATPETFGCAISNNTSDFLINLAEYIRGYSLAQIEGVIEKLQIEFNKSGNEKV